MFVASIPILDLKIIRLIIRFLLFLICDFAYIRMDASCSLFIWILSVFIISFGFETILRIGWLFE